MKNLNIKGITLLLGILVFSISSCTEELDLAPKSSVGDTNYFNNSDEVETAVVAIYDGLQNVPLREFALTEMRSDNTRTKSSEGDWAQFQDLDVAPTNVVVADYWAANYNVIFRANLVLENLAVVTNGKSDQFEGEAKFARALGHFNLVRAYGDVPIVDKVIIQTDTDYFSQDATSDVYNVIIADLQEAIAKLPGKSAMSPGRATSEAASALLGKVLLTTGNYSGAATALKTVIDGGSYSLVEDYNDVFYSEQGSEIVFAIPYLDDAGDQIIENGDSQDFSFEFTAGGRVSGLNYPTPEFLAWVDPAETERSATLFRADVAPTECGKFLTASANVRECGNDWIVLRYADVLLMYTEALMAGAQSTNNSEAIASFNQVRTRAGMPEASGALTKSMLLDERRIEFAFENHRLYDLIRLGVAVSVMGDFASANGYNFQPTDLLLPKPQIEINLSNGLLAQNPGY